MTRDELLLAMLREWFDVEGTGQPLDGGDAPEFKVRMGRALRVVVGECLRQPTQEEAEGSVKARDGKIFIEGLRWFVNSRRYRLLPEMAEERVTRKYHPMNKCSIWLDGQMVCEFDNEVHANRYADGLVAELKKERQ